MANRLGFTHVDELLDELSPEEFAERFAHYLLSGEGEERLSLAVVISELRNLGTRLCAALAGRNPPESHYAKPEDFMAKLYRPLRPKAKRVELDAEQLARQLGAL